MTRSRLLWFAGIFVLVTPILLGTFRGADGLTWDIWALSLGAAAALGVVNAIVFGKSRDDRARSTAGAE